MAEPPVILITGASSGIGAATARLFGAKGYRLVLAARSIDRLHIVAEEIINGGGNALTIRSDISRLEDIQHLANLALDHYKQIDILFNNAGFGRIDWLENLEPDKDIQTQISVNLTGMILLSQAVLPSMIHRQSGHIINMSSIAGLLTAPTYTIYAASKYGVRGFSDALRREVGIHNIKVSVIYPGGVSTEFGKKAQIKRKTGVTTPPAIRLSAEDVALSVYNLAKKPRRYLIIPWPMKFAVYLSTFAPWLVDWITERYFVGPERLSQ